MVSLSRGLLATLACSMLALAPVASLAGDRSVSYLVDPAHDGNVRLKKFSPPLSAVWSRHFKGEYVSYPIVAKGLVFVITDNGLFDLKSKLYALNAQTGATVWHRELPDNDHWGGIAYDNGILFADHGSGILEAISADISGSLLYTLNLSGGGGIPTARGGSLYVYNSNSVVSIEEASGTIQWTAGTNPGGSPIVGDDGIYVTPACTDYKFDRLTGRQDWVYYIGCDSSGEQSAYFAKRLYARDTMGNLIFDARNGKVVGEFAADVVPAFYQDAAGRQFEYTVVDHQLYGVDVASGNVVWTFDRDLQMQLSPIVVNGMVVQGSASGRLFLLDGETGKELWSVGLHTSMEQMQSGPITGLGAGDGLLVVPAKEKLFAFKSN